MRDTFGVCQAAKPLRSSPWASAFKYLWCVRLADSLCPLLIIDITFENRIAT